MKYDVYICGMRVEKYVGEGPGESAFDMEPMECIREILFCTVPEFRQLHFNIIIENEYGWCGSGYTTANWGLLRIDSNLLKFGPATHIPKNHKSIKLLNAYFDTETWTVIFDDDDNDEVDYGVFSFEDCGDEYYPNSWYSVNYDLFDELPRAIKERPVWVFYGDSGSGKSTIANYLSQNKTIYETDSANNGVLPKEIWADIIVIGNKWKNITVDDVKKRISDACIIEVRFDKQEGQTNG